MTHIIFLPVVKLCPILLSYYKMIINTRDILPEVMVNNKRKVLSFIKEWCEVARDAFYEDNLIIQLTNVNSIKRR